MGSYHRVIEVGREVVWVLVPRVSGEGRVAPVSVSRRDQSTTEGPRDVVGWTLAEFRSGPRQRLGSDTKGRDPESTG